jgi:hypothetical protein
MKIHFLVMGAVNDADSLDFECEDGDIVFDAGISRPFPYAGDNLGDALAKRIASRAGELVRESFGIERLTVRVDRIDQAVRVEVHAIALSEMEQLLLESRFGDDSDRKSTRRVD